MLRLTNTFSTLRLSTMISSMKTSTLLLKFRMLKVREWKAMTLRLALPSRMKIYLELSASTSARLLSAKWTSLLTFNSHVKTELLDRSNATAKPKSLLKKSTTRLKNSQISCLSTTLLSSTIRRLKSSLKSYLLTMPKTKPRLP